MRQTKLDLCKKKSQYVKLLDVDAMDVYRTKLKRVVAHRSFLWLLILYLKKKNVFKSKKHNLKVTKGFNL